MPDLLALAGTAAVAGCAAVPDVRPPAVVSPRPAGIAGYITAAADLTTLAIAVRGGVLGRALAGPGPVTVFAPTDAAFARMTPDAVASLFRPENRALLARLLAGHVVVGALTAADLSARVAAGNGSATLTSIGGESLTVTMTSGYLTLTDATGDRSYVERGDIARAGGIVHVVNGILLPRGD